MGKTAIRIGPQDHGRRMSLDEFDDAHGQEGYLYELGRAVVTVMNVPGRRHLAQVEACRDQLYAYKGSHPGSIHTIAGGSDCKLPVAGYDSERHPDLAIYLTPPPREERERDAWSLWVPDIVIEIVSPESAQRDYVEKREEYLAFGVREYWIVDADKGEMLVLRRSRGQWAERSLRAPATYTTRLLPGLEFSVEPVFSAGEES